MRYSVLLCIFVALFGQLQAGNFVGKGVMVAYNVFTVIEGESFSMTCTAEHEDRRPDLQWYFLNHVFARANLTSFASNGKGNLAILPFSRRARLTDSGDYHCFAKVGEEKDQQKTSDGIPIQVIKRENRPRVMITAKRLRGKNVLTCSVSPRGHGFLTWFHDGDRLKHKKLANKLELETTLSGEFQCHGNLTLGGYKYFISTAYATAAAGWSHTTQTTFLSLILVCFIAIFNL